LAKIIKTTRRRGSSAGLDVVSNLNELISGLIKENRQLQRRLDRLASTATAKTSSGTERALRSLQRRVTNALTHSKPVRKAVTKVRKAITDPAVLERRRAALTKARAVRAANKRNAAAAE
jgi:uncharacterized membrane protein